MLMGMKGLRRPRVLEGAEGAERAEGARGADMRAGEKVFSKFFDSARVPCSRRCPAFMSSGGLGYIGFRV